MPPETKAVTASQRETARVAWNESEDIKEIWRAERASLQEVCRMISAERIRMEAVLERCVEGQELAKASAKEMSQLNNRHARDIRAESEQRYTKEPPSKLGTSVDRCYEAGSFQHSDVSLNVGTEVAMQQTLARTCHPKTIHIPFNIGRLTSLIELVQHIECTETSTKLYLESD